MRHVFVSFGLLLAAIGPAAGQSATPDDERAVRAIVDHWKQAWDSFDASVLPGDYTDDADWLNAFGVKKKGAAEILAFMNGTIKRQNVQERKTAWDEPHVRFLRPDVAIVYRDYRTIGMKSLDGTEIPQRNTHGTWILTKDAGKWRVASQIISDDNGR